MKYTVNYNFKKPEPLDTRNINDINESFDLVDGKLKEVEESNSNLDATFQSLIINAGSSNAEIVSARRDNIVGVTYDTLPKRLDAVTSQLSEIETVKVSKNEAGVITHDMLSQTVREEMTGGSVAVVGNGAILEDNIVNKQVTPPKVSFMDYVEGSANILDISSLTSGWINAQDGSIQPNVSPQNYGYTKYIPVSSGQVYKIYSNTTLLTEGFRMVAAYDSSKNFIAASSTSVSSNSYTVPSGVSYVIFDINNYTSATSLKYMILEGTTAPTSYIDYVAPRYEINESVIQGVKSEITGKLDNKEGAVTPTATSFMELSKSKNRYNVSSLVSGFISPSLGTLNASTTTYTTDYIEVTNTHLVSSILSTENVQSLQTMRFLAEYDENKVVITHTDASFSNLSSVTLSANAKYVRITYTSTLINNKIQIEFNSSSTFTTYEDYYANYYKFKDTHLKNVMDKIGVIESGLESILYGKKVAWFGTSITQGYSWCQLVNNYFNFNSTNNGVGGTAICYESISSMCTKERLLGQYSNVTDPNTGEITYTGVAIPSDVEIIFIEGGTNDWARNWALGSTKEITYDENGLISLDTSTFYGACHQMFKNITELYPNAIVIAVGSPFGKMPNRAAFTNKYGLINNQGLQSIEYGDALVDVAGMWGFKGFNFGRLMGIHDNNITTYIPDGLHLTTVASQKKSSNVIIDELLKIKNL